MFLGLARHHRRVPDLLVGGVLRGARRGSGSAANGRRRSPRASRSAASRRPSPRAPRSAPGRWSPIMVSSLVVVFAVVELLFLPFVAQTIFLDHEPLVAGAWMALSVKTDGAAVASGAITESLDPRQGGGAGHQLRRAGSSARRRRSRCSSTSSSASGPSSSPTSGPRTSRSAKATRRKAGEIWQRFPKFVIGYVVTLRADPVARAQRRRPS